MYMWCYSTVRLLSTQTWMNQYKGLHSYQAKPELLCTWLCSICVIGFTLRKLYPYLTKLLINLFEGFIKHHSVLCEGFVLTHVTVCSSLCRAHLPGGSGRQFLWIPAQIMADDQQAWRGSQGYVLWVYLCYHEQTGQAHSQWTHLHHRHEEWPTR